MRVSERGREIKPAKETERAEAETIMKMKPRFFINNGDTPITLLALLGIFFSSWKN